MSNDNTTEPRRDSDTVGGLVRQIKCCRCKHVHIEADRVKVPDRKHANFFNQVCPRCGARSYYMLRADGTIAKAYSEWGKPNNKVSGPEPAAKGTP